MAATDTATVQRRRSSNSNCNHSNCNSSSTFITTNVQHRNNNSYRHSYRHSYRRN